jgi:hypothetical protein
LILSLSLSFWQLQTNKVCFFFPLLANYNSETPSTHTRFSLNTRTVMKKKKGRNNGGGFLYRLTLGKYTHTH